MRSVRKLLVAGAALAALGGVLVAPAAQAAPAAATSQYIVRLTGSGPVDAALQGLLAQVGGGSVQRTYSSAIRGGLVELPDALAPVLAALPGVAGIERNAIVTLSDTTQNGATYGIDRIDQRNLPLSGTYTYANNGAGVRAYMIDTGIGANPDFGGRVVAGTNTVDSSPSTEDCNGHGTHTAGTVGSATWGVAKGVTLVAVRVFGCEDSTTTDAIIAGVDWATADHDPGEHAVANMSLGGGASDALDAAVRGLIADGVVVGIAAGNDGANGCGGSPARVTEGIIVGATDSNDARASFSNFGTCLDVHAPGVDITSTAPGGGTAVLSGTSMATPHVVGAAALLVQANPNATPAQIQQLMIDNATPNVVTGIKTSCTFLDNLLGSCMAGTPNRLLYTGPAGAPPPPPPPPPPACTGLNKLLGLC
jgi:subtilisin family serine protease